MLAHLTTNSSVMFVNENYNKLNLASPAFTGLTSIETPELKLIHFFCILMVDLCVSLQRPVGMNEP